MCGSRVRISLHVTAAAPEHNSVEEGIGSCGRALSHGPRIGVGFIRR
jgi:hypothetical protein